MSMATGKCFWPVVPSFLLSLGRTTLIVKCFPLVTAKRKRKETRFLSSVHQNNECQPDGVCIGQVYLLDMVHWWSWDSSANYADMCVDVFHLSVAQIDFYDKLPVILSGPPCRKEMLCSLCPAGKGCHNFLWMRMHLLHTKNISRTLINLRHPRRKWITNQIKVI
jgi:hypothetical protein